jgi:transcription antitermination factor NusG
MVAERLIGNGLHAYVAEYETRVLWGARRRQIKTNLLPGYVFVEAAMDLERYVRLLQTPGVVKLVGNPWPRLSWVPVEQFKSLQLVLKSRERFENEAFWQPGDNVEVIAGPLKGVRGLYSSMANEKGRVIVSIDLLHRSLSVEVGASDLRWRPLQAAS